MAARLMQPKSLVVSLVVPLMVLSVLLLPLGVPLLVMLGMLLPLLAVPLTLMMIWNPLRPRRSRESSPSQAAGGWV